MKMMKIYKLLIILLYQILNDGNSLALRPSFPSIELESPSLASSSSSSSSSATSSSLSQESSESSDGYYGSALPLISSSRSSLKRPIITKTHIISIETNCTRDLFDIEIELNKKFRGILFTKDFSDECRTRGNLQTKIKLRIPTSGCGVRSELKSNGSLELSVKIMLQMDEKLRQSSDILKMIKCYLPPNMMNMDLIRNEEINKNFR